MLARKKTNRRKTIRRKTIRGKAAPNRSLSFSARRTNLIKLDDFLRDKPCEIVKTEITFPNFPLSFVSPTQLVIRQMFPPIIIPFRRYNFKDFVYKEFHRHFKTNLRNIKNLDLAKEFNNFIDSYRIKPQPKKKGRPRQENTSDLIKAIEKGDGITKITKDFGEQIFIRQKALFISEGYSEQKAESMARKDVMDWRRINRSLIREKIRYYKDKLE